MGGAFVTKDCAATSGLISPGFSLHQHSNASGQTADFVLLTSHDVAQLFNCPCEMRDLFF